MRYFFRSEIRSGLGEAQKDTEGTLRRRGEARRKEEGMTRCMVGEAVGEAKGEKGLNSE